MSPLAFLSMGISEMILVAVVALLVFGGRLPEVMHTLGKTYAKFRRGMTELSHPIRNEMRRLDEQARAPRPSAPDRGHVPADDEPPPYEVPEDSPAPTPSDAKSEPPTGDGAKPPPPSTETGTETASRGAIDEPPPV